MKRLSPEALLTQDADIILIGRLSQHHPQTAPPADPADYPNLAQTAAGQKPDCLIQINVNVMESLGFGPSYAAAARDISRTAAQYLNP